MTPQIVKQTHCLVPTILDELEEVKVSSFATMADKMVEGRKQSPNTELIPESWCSAIPEKYRQRKVQLGECNSDSYYMQ